MRRDSVRPRLMQRLTDTSSVTCGRQLIAHRNSCSSYSGVPHGLFSMNSPPDCLFRNAHAPGLRPSMYAPCFPFGKARCSGRLIFQKQSAGLFLPKRSTSRALPLRVNLKGSLKEAATRISDNNPIQRKPKGATSSENFRTRGTFLLARKQIQ